MLPYLIIFVVCIEFLIAALAFCAEIIFFVLDLKKIKRDEEPHTKPRFHMEYKMFEVTAVFSAAAMLTVLPVFPFQEILQRDGTRLCTTFIIYAFVMIMFVWETFEFLKQRFFAKKKEPVVEK